MSEISAEVRAGVGTVTFERPERRNALSLGLLGALSDQLAAWADDDDVACIVLTGAGEVFCAGLDLQLQSGFTEQTRASYGDACLRAYGLLLDHPKPTIAAVEGAALGGGLDIAVFCDIRIASTTSVFGYPQIKLGLTPYFSPLWKIVGLSQAKLLTFSGDRIDATEALRIGLVDRLAPAGDVLEAAGELASSIAATSTASAVNNKEIARRSPAMDPISALTYETMAYREVIWHADVVARVESAYEAIGSRRTTS